MAYDRNTSPVGWYLASYLLRFVELDSQELNNPDKRFLSWENTVIVKAGTLEGAYAKVERIGKSNARPYNGGPNGERVRWEYLGVTELVPIYEELADGAEIAWTERPKTSLRALRARVRAKRSFRQ